MKWRIYYGDGTTFDDTMGEPEDAPAFDVQCIVFPNKDHGKTMLQRFDWYYWHKEDGWWGGDLFGVLDLFMHFPKLVIALKAGRNIGNDKYKDILDRAINDPDFPVKTGSVKGEDKYNK